MEKKEECKTCKKGLTTTHWTMVIASFYLLFAAVYGTIKIVQNIIDSF
jgi:hypothetical protein